MKKAVKVFIGYDHREDAAFKVAVESLLDTTSVPVAITPIELSRNEDWGVIDRPWRIFKNSIWDVLSEAPASTMFAISRFLTPILGQNGPALFVDCDVVFLEDIAKLFALFDTTKAVQCVKHEELNGATTKMMDQVQTYYSRKNWSSVMLFNCDHPSNRLLNLIDINHRPGRDLHNFYWLADDVIGGLPPEWNWLVNVEQRPSRPGIAHFTLGGPWIKDWVDSPYDHIWTEALLRHEEAAAV